MMTSSYTISFMSLLRSREVTEMDVPAIDLYPASPLSFLLVKPNPFETRTIMRWTFAIGAVLKWSSWTKVGNSIVKGVPISMTNSRRNITMDIEKC
jgi:N6-adenosine-specific RNA methylase IME4